MEKASLYVVPTPIGNLKDITFRAIEILNEVDLVLCEDTRTSQILFKHYDIHTPTKSYHIHNEHAIVEKIINELKEGKRYALVSDAGSPAISDPGYLLVKACVDNGLNVEALPGPTALIPALTVASFPNEKFIFEGFMPHKKGKKAKIEELLERNITTVFYESPHRIQKTLEQLLNILGENREVAVCRELTKIHEEVIRGTLKEVSDQTKNRKLKGEIVLVINGI